MSGKFVIAKKRAVVCKHKCTTDCPREQTNPGTCWNVHLDGARFCDSVKNGTPCLYGAKCNRSHTPKEFGATNEYLKEVLPHWTPNAEDEQLVQDMESGKFAEKKAEEEFIDEMFANMEAKQAEPTELTKKEQELFDEFVDEEANEEAKEKAVMEMIAEDKKVLDIVEEAFARAEARARTVLHSTLP